MKKLIRSTLPVAVIFILVFWGNALAATFPGVVSQAMSTLDVEKGDKKVLMMTNIPYITVNGKPALSFLEQAQDITGCMVGKGNLFFFQRPQQHPLRLMLFKKSDGRAVIISRLQQDWFSETLNLSAETVLSPSFWKTVKEDYKAGADMFTLAVMANVWAKDGPYDFLKAAELHNHICPGLTSGYLLAHYILDHYPLKKAEHYTVIASPVWCKEDAFQVILDCTPGKKGLVVKPLSDEQIQRISIVDPACILLVWNNKTKTGKGMALSFHFDRLRALTSEGSPKAAAVLAALPQLDRPDQFVSTSAVFDLNETLYTDIQQAGSNPYEIAGLVKK
ncbi:MAG: FmdE family protein [Pseudomonadota bacterium]